jgi:hypothetical protein
MESDLRRPNREARERAAAIRIWRCASGFWIASLRSQ